jgi:hypothetical protein
MLGPHKQIMVKNCMQNGKHKTYGTNSNWWHAIVQQTHNTLHAHCSAMEKDVDEVY